MTEIQEQLLRTIPETEIAEMLAKLGKLKVEFPTESVIDPAQVEVNTDPCPVIEADGKLPNTIRVKVISPGQGSTGYYATEVLMRDMPGLIKPGVQMFWDHPKKGESREAGTRSLDRLAGKFASEGTWENNAVHGPGVYADVQPLNGFGPKIRELAKHNAFGLSILGEGLAREGVVGGRTTKIFETMTKINSVDFVTAAGRGGKVVELFEAAVTTPSQEIKEDGHVGLIQVDEKEYQGLITRVSAMEASVKELPKIQAQLTTVSQENVTLKAEAIINKRLDASGLKLAARPKVVAEMLAAVDMTESGAIDEKAFGAAIDVKVTEWLTLVGKEPVTVTKFSGVSGLGIVEGVGTQKVDLTESKKRGEAAMSRLVKGYVAQTA